MAVALPYTLSTPFVVVVFEAEVSEMLNHWFFQMTKKGGGNAIPDSRSRISTARAACMDPSSSLAVPGSMSEHCRLASAEAVRSAASVRPSVHQSIR